MEDNGQNSMISMMIGLVVVLLVAGVIFVIYRAGKSISQKALTKVTDMGVQLDEGEFTDLEGMTIKGVEVINYLKQWSNREVCLSVATKNGTTTNYNYSDESLSSESTATLADAQKKSSPGWINPNGNFEVAISRDANDGIAMVTFTQQ